MQVPVSSIKVEQRVRTEMGDLNALKESMRKHGQISPILLTRQHVLIAGHRRLSAAIQLGWHEINAECIDAANAADQLEIELQENVYRKDFTPEELLMGYRRLDKLRSPAFTSRISRFFRWLFNSIFRRRKKAVNENDIQPEKNSAAVDKEEKKETGDSTENEIYGC